MSSGPRRADPELGRLHASVHLLDGEVVVHFLDRSDRLVGFSVGAGAFPEGGTFPSERLDAAFEDGPDSPGPP